MSNEPYLNYIGGEWLPSESGEMMDIRDPAIGEIMYRVAASTPVDVDRAVAAARDALEASGWRKDAERRTVALRRMAERLAGRQERFRELLIKEAGTTFPVARAEAGMVVQSTNHYADLVRWLFGRSLQPTPGSLSLLLH